MYRIRVLAQFPELCYRIWLLFSRALEAGISNNTIYQLKGTYCPNHRPRCHHPPPSHFHRRHSRPNRR